MRIAIIGCGAIGSIYASHLARLDDVEVHAYDVWEEHVRTIRQTGLRVTGDRDFTVRFHATSNPDEIPRCDAGILATKATHVEDAMEQTRDLFGPDSPVASVQNGLGSERIMARYVDRILAGSTFQAGKILGPGRILFEVSEVSFLPSGETTALGPWGDSSTLEDARTLTGLLNDSGLDAAAVEDIEGVKWTKLIYNASTNPPGALCRMFQAHATEYEPTRGLFRDLVEECAAVARAHDVSLTVDPWAMVEAVANEISGEHRASMLDDVLQKNPTEIDFITGAVVRAGREAGVETPRNETILALVKGLEQSWGSDG